MVDTTVITNRAYRRKVRETADRLKSENFFDKERGHVHYIRRDLGAAVIEELWNEVTPFFKEIAIRDAVAILGSVDHELLTDADMVARLSGDDPDPLLQPVLPGIYLPTEITVPSDGSGPPYHKPTMNVTKAEAKRIWDFDRKGLKAWQSREVNSGKFYRRARGMDWNDEIIPTILKRRQDREAAAASRRAERLAEKKQ